MNQYIPTFSYLFFIPVLLLSSSVWFTSDDLGILLSSLFLFYSVFLFIVFWFIECIFLENSCIKSMILVFQLLLLIGSCVLIFINSFISSLLLLFFFSYHSYFFKISYILLLHKNICNVFNELNIIFSICCILMVAFLSNPYTQT